MAADGTTFQAQPCTCGTCSDRGAVMVKSGDLYAGTLDEYGPCPDCRIGALVREGQFKAHLSAISRTIASYGDSEADAVSQSILALYARPRPAGARGRALVAA